MPGELDPQTELRLKTTRESLHAEFDPIHPTERVDAILDDSIAQVRSDAGFDDYVPALAERLCRDRLKAAARKAGLVERGVPEVLFVALNDTGRGQMGAAILRSIAGARLNVHSAGTAGRRAPVDAGVAEAMREIGLGLDDAYSKPLTPEVLAAADVVVTMGRSAGVVEIPEGTRHVDWRIGDPSGAPIDEVRHVRDDIRARIELLLRELVPAEG
jgi:protein-tyrosine-phosphatase